MGLAGTFRNFYEEVKNPTDKRHSYRHQKAPEWIRWRTSNRKAYAEHMPALMAALRDLPVRVSLSSGWTWLRGEQSERPEGKTQYRHQFELMLSFDEKFKFDPDAFLNAHNAVCVSNDPRADRSIFEIAEDSGCPVIDGSCQWTKKGFNLRVWSKAKALALRDIFPDCHVELHKEKCSVGVSWTLETTFPA